MIPDKKKSTEEISALRSQLGIPCMPPQETFPAQQPHPTIHPEPLSAPIPTEFTETDEPVFRLNLPPIPATNQQIQKPTTLNTVSNNPSAPYPSQTQKSQLPTHRRSQSEIAELRRREHLAMLTSNQAPHTQRLKSLIAHPLLLIITYLPSIAAPITVWQKYQYTIPLSLIVFSTLLTFYIFLVKKRSSHHAAFVTIINIITIGFGFTNYPELLPHAP